MKKAILDQFAENIDRVDNLVTLYVKLRGAGRGRRPVNSSDVLRAAVVLLHATLEDFFRNLALDLLPSAAPNALTEVPLAGTGLRRSEKFTLTEIAQFRDKSVSDLIESSVKEHLDRTSYNNPGQLKNLLELLEIDVDPLAIPWDDVGAMMSRRHHIVHQTDRNPKRGSGHHKAQSISEARVNIWIEAVKALVAQVATVV